MSPSGAPVRRSGSNLYASLTSANAEQTSFYSDDEHFSAAGQLIEANYEYSLLTPLPAALPLFGTGLVCGAVNSKNQMGGYVGMTGFVYWPRQDRAILLWSGRTDPDYTYATVVHYCRYCVSNPKADKSIQSHCDSERSQIDSYPN
jgi:hypothetical protein